MRKNLGKMIIVRGVLVTLAMVALVVAVVWAAATTLFRTSDAVLTPTLSLVRTQSDEDQGFSVSAKLTGAPDGSIARLRLGEGGNVLGSQLVGASGTVELTVAMPSGGAEEPEVYFELIQGNKTLAEGSVDLSAGG